MAHLNQERNPLGIRNRPNTHLRATTMTTTEEKIENVCERERGRGGEEGVEERMRKRRALALAI